MNKIQIKIEAAKQEFDSYTKKSATVIKELESIRSNKSFDYEDNFNFLNPKSKPTEKAMNKYFIVFFPAPRPFQEANFFRSLIRLNTVQVFSIFTM